ALPRGLAHQDFELLDARGLGEVVVGAELHRFHRARYLLEAGGHDHLRRLPALLGQTAQHLDALEPRHLHVEDEHVGRVVAQPLERGLAVTHALHRVPLPRQLAHEELAEVLLVVGDQDTDRGGHRIGSPDSGSVVTGGETRKTAPPPGRDSTSMRPAWSATIPCAMARPSPVPCPGGLVVKNGSNSRGRISGGTPGPASWNSISASPLRSTVRMVRRPRPSIASRALAAMPRNTWRSWPSLATTGGSARSKGVTR